MIINHSRSINNTSGTWVDLGTDPKTCDEVNLKFQDTQDRFWVSKNEELIIIGGF